MISNRRSLMIFKAIWPHVLLIVLLVIYIIGGAIAFVYLEHPTEMRLKHKGARDVEKQKVLFQQFVWSSLIASSAMIAENGSESLPDTFHENETLNSTGPELQWRKQFDAALAEYTRVVLRSAKENFIEYSDVFETETKTEDLWTLPAATLFAFSAVTTIGYGNIAPITFNGRLFCIFYGLVGIPFAMLVLANVGKFLSEGLQHVVSFWKKQFNRSVGTLRFHLRQLSKHKSVNNNNNGSICSVCNREEDSVEPIDQPLPFVCLIGLVFLYICLGAVLLPTWESLSFFDAFYFNFVTITTTGYGDLVPQRYGYLAVTLTYVAVGIAMTTMCIEAAAAYMRKLHYVGRRIQGAKFTRIRFGDKAITLDELITLFGAKMGVPTVEVARLKTKLDSFVATAIEAKKLSEEEQVAAMTNFDLQSLSMPNGGPGLQDYSDEDSGLAPTYLDISTSLRRLLGPFNVSSEDIRYIDDDRIESVI